MLTLLTKDIRALFANKKGGGHTLKTVLTLVTALLFALIEYGIMRALFSKAESLISAPITLATAILTVISVIMTVIAFARASKLFFDKQDTSQIAIRPVSSAIVTTSRLLALTVMHCATAALFEYPVFLAYISVYNRSVWFYYMAFAYPLLAGLCEMGIALAILYPIRLLWQYVTKKLWLRLSVTAGIAAITVTLCAIFIHKSTAILAEKGFVGFLTDPWTEKAIKLNDFVLPINLLIDYMFKRTNGLYPYIAISVGIFWLGTSFDAFFLHKIRLTSVYAPTAKPQKLCDEASLEKYLLKKELKMRINDARCSLAFPLLLILQPYTLYLVSRIIGTWLAPDMLIPMQSRFANVAPLIITLCAVALTLVIYSLSDTSEIIKSGAIKPYDLIHPTHKAVFIAKTLMPITLSAAFSIISIIVLTVCGILSPLHALFTLLMSATSLATVAMVSCCKDSDARADNTRAYYTSSAFSCSFVILFIIFGSLLTLIGCPVWAVYLISTVAFFALGALPCRKTVNYVKTIAGTKKSTDSNLI